MKRKVAKLSTLMVAALILTGCSLLPAARPRSTLQQQATPTPIPTPVIPTKPTYQVQKGEVVRKLQFTGRIAAVQEKELFFRVAGRVRTVAVKQQDQVKAGQLMADLENDSLERDLTAARLEFERVQGRVVQAQTDQADNIKKAQIQLEIARQNLDIAQAADPAPRKSQAEAELRKAQINLQQAQDAYNAIAWRNDKGASAQAAALEQATLDSQTAKAAYDLAMQSITTHQHEIAIQQQQVQLAQLAVDTLKRGVDPAIENDLKSAELNVKKLEAALSDSQIVAPFDGLITSVSAYEGRAAEAFRPVITVADPKALEVRVDTTSTPTNELAEGMPATMTLVGRPGIEIPGTIRRLPNIGTAATDSTDADKSLRISIDDNSADSAYQMGDLARVNIVLERKQDVLWLPPAAIRTFEGRRFVVIQDGGAQRRVDVKVGIEGEDRTEIQEGLTENQTIIGQ